METRNSSGWSRIELSVVRPILGSRTAEDTNMECCLVLYKTMFVVVEIRPLQCSSHFSALLHSPGACHLTSLISLKNTTLPQHNFNLLLQTKPVETNLNLAIIGLETAATKQQFGLIQVGLL